jgi:hypothetical protein
MHTLACIVNMNKAKPTLNRAVRGLEPTRGLKMRSLAEIVAANREADKLGIKPALGAVGVNGAHKPGDGGTILTPERMQQLGLDKY